MKLKGISVCFSMLNAALGGNYVNFGVFKLYGDDTLDNVLNTTIKLILSIPQSDLLVSFKSSVYYESLIKFIYIFTYRNIQSYPNPIMSY